MLVLFFKFYCFPQNFVFIFCYILKYLCLDDMPCEHGELLQMWQGLLFYSEKLFLIQTIL